MLKLDHVFEARFNTCLGDKVKENTIAHVDAIKRIKSVFGVEIIMFRVVNIWSRPKWLSCSWFKGLEKRKI